MSVISCHYAVANNRLMETLSLRALMLSSWLCVIAMLIQDPFGGAASMIPSGECRQAAKLIRNQPTTAIHSATTLTVSSSLGSNTSG